TGGSRRGPCKTERHQTILSNTDKEELLAISKHVVYGEESLQWILRGGNHLADAVKVTLGPGGRNVVLEKKFGGPTTTKGGVTVAKEIELEDKSEERRVGKE